MNVECVGDACDFHKEGECDFLRRIAYVIYILLLALDDVFWIVFCVDVGTYF